HPGGCLGHHAGDHGGGHRLPAGGAHAPSPGRLRRLHAPARRGPGHHPQLGDPAGRPPGEAGAGGAPPRGRGPAARPGAALRGGPSALRGEDAAASAQPRRGHRPVERRRPPPPRRPARQAGPAGERGAPGMRRLYSRLGRFDVRFRYLIVVAWVVITVVCVATLPGLGSVAKDTESGFLPANSPSMHAAQLLNPFESSTLATTTLVASRSGGALTAGDKLAVNSLVAKIKELPHVVTAHSLGTSSDGEATQALIQANVPQYGGGTGTTLVDSIRSDFSKVGA